jgi:hypothetical protein
MVALDMYEADLCGGCRLPTSIRQDPSNLFRIRHDVCPVCAQMAPAGRAQADADKKAHEALGKDPSPLAKLPGDGRTSLLVRVGSEARDAAVPSNAGDDRDNHHGDTVTRASG